jgi:hypothetical protein
MTPPPTASAAVIFPKPARAIDGPLLLLQMEHNTVDLKDAKAPLDKLA